MTIEVSCRCGQRFVAQPHLYGKQVACPVCRRPLTIPAPPSQSVKVTCACGQSFKAKASLAGTRAACPACGRPLNIPLAPTPSVDPLFSDDLNDLMSQSLPPPTPATQSTAIPRPVGYAQEDDFSDVLRNALKRISLGICSFAIAILAGLTYLIMVVSLRNTSRAEFDSNRSLAFTVGLIILIMLGACLAGTVLGAVSIKHDGRDRVLAYLGIVFNVLIILLFGCCGVASALFSMN